jgi:phosphotransferase system enzyme I (PtsI)
LLSRCTIISFIAVLKANENERMSTGMTKMVNGIASSAGITIAKAYLLHSSEVNKTENLFRDQEIRRLNEAISLAKKEYGEKQNTSYKKAGQTNPSMNIHQLILQDYDLIDQMKSRIQFENNKAEKAWSNVTKKYINMFEQMDTEYMKVRAEAIRDVTKSVLAHLERLRIVNKVKNSENIILIAEDITNSDIAHFNLKYIKGFATNNGTASSHAAIMARSMGIPAVVGTKCITSEVHDGANVILDGLEGKVIINPSIDVINEYQMKLKEFEEKNRSWMNLLR